MPKPLNPEKPSDDVAPSLAGLGEKTTAAELVRTKGQSKKLTVITEKQLMEWVNAEIRKSLKSKADNYSDQEKGEMLKKLQEELAKRIKDQGEKQAERDKALAERDKALAKAAEAQMSTSTREQTDEAIDSLKKQLEESLLTIDSLQ